MSGLRLHIDHRGDSGFSLALDVTLPESGVTALFGPSGSGKTTVLDCIAGLRSDIDGARVSFAGESWQANSRRAPPWARSIGYVFQDARLFPHLDVRGNLEFASKRAAGAALSVPEVARALDIEALLNRQTDTLSAGQSQRVAIARALLTAPKLLLLDEPLANLDRDAAAHCLECLSHVARESQVPMLYVSHRIEEVAAIADHLLLLRDGRVEAEGPLPEMLSRLDHSLATDADAAAVLLTDVKGEDDYGLTVLEAEGEALLVAGKAPAASRQRLRVPARDVSVCRERPARSSILNIIPVVLEELRELSQTHCLLRLRFGQQFLLARITERSRQELALRPGDRLYAQIKSSALVEAGKPL